MLYYEVIHIECPGCWRQWFHHACMERSGSMVTHIWIHEELDDFTSSNENGHHPLNTTGHDTCCLPFSAEYCSTCWWSPFGFCLL